MSALTLVPPQVPSPRDQDRAESRRCQHGHPKHHPRSQHSSGMLRMMDLWQELACTCTSHDLHLYCLLHWPPECLHALNCLLQLQSWELNRLSYRNSTLFLVAECGECVFEKVFNQSLRKCLSLFYPSITKAISIPHSLYLLPHPHNSPCHDCPLALDSKAMVN